ncbi:unnamed protein product, partial [Meganyctiphanes norvegica]
MKKRVQINIDDIEHVNINSDEINEQTPANLDSRTNNKNWIHPPEALQKGHIAYLVKYLGSTEVDQPKGIEVVKEGIRKLKFNQHLKKAEGSKTPKVELTVSIDGVAIHEPKTKRNLHQYPLHRISYCADDKAEKRFFSFIAKEADSDKHTCFVFVSDKLAEEITLTIGQAFDLAYRRFVETSAKEVELRKQILTLQKRTEILETENEALKTRITQLTALKDRSDLQEYMSQNNVTDILTINDESITDFPVSTEITLASINPSLTPPPVPPRNAEKITSDPVNITNDILSSPSTSNGSDDDFNPRAIDEDDFNPRALENMTPSNLTTDILIKSNITQNSIPINKTNSMNGFNELSGRDDFDDFDPRAEEKKPPSYSTTAVIPPDINGFKAPPLIPPPRPVRPQDNPKKISPMNGSTDLRCDSASADPFGSTETMPPPPISNSNTDILAHFNEMKAGFSRGLSFGTADDDFTLESLDPLKN